MINLNLELDLADYVRLTKVAEHEGRSIADVAFDICHLGCLTSVAAAGIILPFGLNNPAAGAPEEATL